MVHDGVYQGLKLLDPVLCKVLMLVVRLTLPVTDAISMQNLLDLVADFNLCPIADELGRGSPGVNLVFQGVDELPVSLHGIDISNQRFHTNKNLGNGSTRVSGRGVQIDGVGSHWLISPVDIQGGKGGLVLLFRRVLMGS